MSQIMATVRRVEKQPHLKKCEKCNGLMFVACHFCQSYVCQACQKVDIYVPVTTNIIVTCGKVVP